MMISIPSREDINPIAEDLDGQMAELHFYGKSQNEAAKLFFEHSTYYLGDLLWMGSKGFSFYFPSLESYLYSEESRDDIEFIDGLRLTLQSRLENDISSIKECLFTVLKVLKYISENMSKFDPSSDVYRDLSKELGVLREKIQDLGMCVDKNEKEKCWFA